ncbi:MAG TPA: amino acid adenylation domain-containing protein [Actinocrinis sp.]|nr:amino acid adenylation domain-containing protein [Actinocrinis sp.]
MRTIGKDGEAGEVVTPRLIPASAKQEALWLLEQLVPGNGVNNVAVSFTVGSPLSGPALQAAVDVVLRRYQVLRTTFQVREGRLQREAAGPDEVSAPISRRTADPEQIERELSAFAAEPFEAQSRPLLRVAHWSLPDRDVVAVCVHHFVFDTISATFLFEDLAEAYDALAAGKPVPAHLSVEVRPTADPTPAEQSIDYWRDRLSSIDADRLGPALSTVEPASPTVAGGFVEHRLSPRAAETARRLSRELHAPEAVVYLSAYYLLLARHGAGPDLVIGSPVNARGAQAARAVGYHVNVLPLRVRVDLEQGLRELVAATRSSYFDALSHADVPVDLLLPELPRTSAAWGNTLFRHLFNYAPGGGLPEFSIGGATATARSLENGTSKFDIELVVQTLGEETVLKGRYAEILDREDVKLLLERYESLLLAAGADPQAPLGRLPYWSERDHAVIGRANATAAPGPDLTVPAAVHGHAVRTPDAVAVESGERAVTYAQLWHAARATAVMLGELGVGDGDLVALAGPRGPELVAAVFGTWLAGAAYLPLDPNHPADRIADQLADSQARAVLLAAGSAALPAAECVVLPMAQVGAKAQDAEVPARDEAFADPQANDCAYMIYTSGSTGRPKGTRVSHGNLANLVAHFRGELSATAEDGGLWMTSFSFDMSVMDLFLPLFAGGRVVVAPDAARTDGKALREVLLAHRVDLAQATPTSWRLVFDEVADLLADMRIICGGEPMPPSLARKLLDSGCELRNPYGPTETTVWSTSGRILEHDPRIHVGRPIRNTVVFIAGPGGQEAPLGVLGELCIAGSGVSLGYHNRPQLLAERFDTHAVYGRFYRTGDRARWLVDGRLELVGRVDRQIKLRGNRIELGEVESVMEEHPEVAAAAVVVVGDPSADAILVAFVQGDPALGVEDRLWQHARSRLPQSAVPHEFVVVDRFPTTSTQKVDYPALVRLAEERRIAASAAGAGDGDGVGAAGAGAGAGQAGAGGADAAGSDELLSSLIGLWGELLNRFDLGGESNFFVSGGHSLLSARLVQQVEERFGVRVPLSEVFSLPTPSQLAAYLRKLGVTDPGAGQGKSAA